MKQNPLFSEISRGVLIRSILQINLQTFTVPLRQTAVLFMSIHLLCSPFSLIHSIIAFPHEFPHFHLLQCCEPMLVIQLIIQLQLSGCSYYPHQLLCKLYFLLRITPKRFLLDLFFQLRTLICPILRFSK